MTVPILSYPQAQVLPTASPVESLDSVINAISKGYAVAQQAPSVGTAIAQGIGDALNNYQKDVTFAQQKEINDQTIQANQIKVDEARQQQEAIKQLPQDVQTAALQAPALKANEEAKKLLQRQELENILNTGDARQITDAFTSGKYIDALTDPQFATAASKAAAPYLPENVRQFYVKAEQASNKAKLDASLQALRAKQLEKVNESIGQDRVISDILANNKDLSLYDILKNTKPIRINEYKIDKDTKQIVRDKQGYPVKTTFDPEDKSNKFFNIINPDTGDIFASNVPEHDLKVYNEAKALYSSATPYLKGGPYEQGMGSTTQKPTSSVPAVPVVTPTLPTGETEKAAVVKGPEIGQAKKSFTKLSLLSDAGTVNLVRPDVVGVFARGVGLPETTTYEKDIGTLLSLVENPISDKDTPEMNQRRIEEYAQAKENVVRGSLKNSFEKNAALKNTYTEAAVKAHNEQVDNATQKFPMLQYSPEYLKVSSPEDLYVANNYQPTSQLIDSLVESLKNQAAQQNAARYRKSGAVSGMLKATSDFAKVYR